MVRFKDDSESGSGLAAASAVAVQSMVEPSPEVLSQLTKFLATGSGMRWLATTIDEWEQVTQQPGLKELCIP